METSAKEKEYIKLKNSLEALGFKGYLGSDTCSLVRNILDNLIKATKAFKTIKLENERLENEMRIQGDLVLPLRNENHKLLQDNNDLHKEIIDIKDKLEIKSSTTDQNLQKSIENVEQMKFLVSQKNIKIKNLEFQVESLKKKLNDVFEDIYMYNREENAAERGLQGSRKFLNYRNGYLPELCPLIKQEYSISGAGKEEPPVPSQAFNNFDPNELLEALKNENKQFNLGKEEWAKDLQQNNNEINQLREGINNLQNTLKDKDRQIEEFQRRIVLRDEEIKRLQNNLYLGDENLEEIKIRYNIDYYREQNEQLKRQNDFLNKENHRLTSGEYFHSHKCKEDEMDKLRGDIEKLKFENNKLRQRSNIYINTSKSKKTATENSKSPLFPANKEEKERKEILKYQKIIRDLTGDKETLKGKLALSNKNISEMKNQYQLLQNENDFLKKKVKTLQTSASNNPEMSDTQNNPNPNGQKFNTNESQILIEQINDLKNKNSILNDENKNLSDIIKMKESEIIKNLNLHQKETDTINKEMTLVKNQNNELQMIKKNLEEQIINLQNQLSNNMSGTLTQNRNVNINTISNNLNENYQDIMNELRESQNNNKMKDDTIKRLSEEKEKMDFDYRLLEIKNKNLNDQVVKLQNEILSNTKEDNINEKLRESNNELRNQIDKQNKDINNLEKTNNELKSIITGIQNTSKEKEASDIDNEEQTLKLTETITKLQKDNNRLYKNLELFQKENHLAAEKIKNLEELIKGK